MANQVVFRRVHGRIVPIKMEEESHGIKRIAAGTAIGGAAGALAGRMDHKASQAAQAHKNLEFLLKQKRLKMKMKAVPGQMAFRLKSAHFEQAAKHRLEAYRGHKAAQRVKVAGAAIGATLIGSGVKQALDKHTNLDETQKSSVATASGLGSYFALRTAHGRVFGRQTLWEAVKHAAHRVSVRGFKL